METYKTTQFFILNSSLCEVSLLGDSCNLTLSFMDAYSYRHSPVFYRIISQRLKAIAHPMRLAIIDLLEREGKMNVTQIYQALDLEQAVASQHLKILKKEGIIDRERQGKHSFYFLRNDNITQVFDLLTPAPPDKTS
jgi:DNA-binding transcriptional ArsR family regulator